jgi:bifunctional DNase/RNase
VIHDNNCYQRNTLVVSRSIVLVVLSFLLESLKQSTLLTSSEADQNFVILPSDSVIVIIMMGLTISIDEHTLDEKEMSKYLLINPHTKDS